ncbi:MAG: hypothetical protein R2751_02540 [Bacteroidales bacterium]
MKESARTCLCCFGLLALLLLGCGNLSAQDPSSPALIRILEDAEKKYGPEPGLVNGQRYYYPYRNVLGNPYLEREGPESSCAVCMNGRTYRQLTLRYDVYNQLLILELPDRHGATLQIVLPGNLVEEFTLGEAHFRRLPGPGGEELFAQVLGEGRVTLLAFWSKYYRTDPKMGEIRHSFSNPVRRLAVSLDGQVREFKGKRGFVHCFGRDVQKGVRAMWKASQIPLGRTSDAELAGFIESVNVYLDEN